jgi:hypothetical protein
MPHAQALYDWAGRVQQAFPALKPHHARALAEYAFGLTLAHTCGLTQVAAHLAALRQASAHTVRRRLRELYQPAHAQKGSARSEFDPADCFGPLVQWAASGQPDKRLLLALDPTCLTDRFRVLCVSVLYQGGALPVAWRVQAAAGKGSWNDIWKDLLGKLKAALGEGWTVLVLTDRGLESADLFRAIVGLGWHPLMRVKKAGTFRPGGWRRGHAMGRFAPAAGRRWAGSGVAYPGGGRLDCTLLACWEPGHAEAWLILTDLPPGGADPAWYAWRMWIEQGFKVVKSGGWQWQRTRMADPARAGRLWAVLAVATLWMVEVGGAAEPARVPPVPKPRPAGPRPRPLRLVRVGLVRLLAALLAGGPLPQGALHPQEWPPRDWEPDPLTEEMMDQS